MISSVTWRVKDFFYTYLTTNDDAALGTCVELAQSSVVTVILPRRHEELKRRLLRAVLRDQAPDAWRFENFISFGILFSGRHAKWHPDRTLVELLAAYNRRVSAAGRGDAVLVDLPEESP